VITGDKNEYTIVKASENNIGWLLQLLKANGSTCISLDQLKKKYDTSYTGHSYIAHFAISSEGQPAAFFCLFPSYLWIDGEKVLAGQSADIITHPNHQRRGLFGLLGRATEDLALQIGMSHLFAFPNSNSFPGFVKSLGWQHTGNFHFQQHMLRSFAWFRIFRRLNLTGVYDRLMMLRIRKIRLNTDDRRLINVNDINGQLRNSSFYKYKEWNGSVWIEYQGLALWLRRDSDYLLIGDSIKLDYSIDDKLKQERLNKLCKSLGLSGWRFETSERLEAGDSVVENDMSFSGVYIVYTNLCNRNQRVTLNFTGGDADVF
jgi:hypothetical protein